MSKKLKRSLTDRMITGVCGGMATYFKIDSTIVRILFAIATVLGIGSPLIIYLILFFLMPED